ncbi:MAG: hypothetical protein WBX00_04430 [Isosphaeraceae bacterium]
MHKRSDGIPKSDISSWLLAVVMGETQVLARVDGHADPLQVLAPAVVPE